MVQAPATAACKAAIDALRAQKSAGVLSLSDYLSLSAEAMAQSDVLLSPAPFSESIAEAPIPSPVESLADTAANSVADPACSEEDSGEDFQVVPESEEAAAAKLKRKSDATEFVNNFLPMTAAIAKKRCVPKYVPPTGQRKSNMSQGQRKGDVSTRTLLKRADPKAGLVVRCGALYCTNCHCSLGSSTTSIDSHKKTQKHKDAVSSDRKIETNSAALESAIEDYRKQEEEDGSRVAGFQSVAKETQLFRADTLEAFLRAGVEVNKINLLRHFLERRCGHRLIHTCHLMNQYLGPLQLKELATVRGEIQDQLFSIYHDETTHNGESFAQISRTCTMDLDIQLRCYNVKWLRNSLKAHEIAAVVISGIAKEARADFDNCVAVQNDSVAANVKAFEGNIATICIYSDMNLCLAHGGNNTGSKIDTGDALDAFMLGFVKCISLSNAARTLWHSIFGKNAKKKCCTRWFSEADVIHESVFSGIENGRLLEWVTKLQGNELCAASVTKMLKILCNRRLFTLFWLECAVVNFVAVPLMADNTFLQGDGFEIITGYPRVAHMAEILNNPITAELEAEIVKIAAQAPGREVAQEVLIHGVDSC